ncbi:MAG: biopolymer transporter ExbD [Elusimicrobia bacterium]|nr:biopolymer transporter ExbD [Elusimicrobiota bacterium]
MQAHDSEEAITGINVTPLVDVCLVLVIIFMVTTPLLNQPSLSIVLPKAHTQEGEERENTTLTLTADGRVALNEKIVEDRKELKGLLCYQIGQTSERHVVLRADLSALHGTLVEMMGLAKICQAKSLTIATEPLRQ